MKPFLLIIHLLTAVSLAGLILLQNGKGGFASGLGAGEFYRSRRGAERMVFVATFILMFVFFVTSVASILVR